MNWKITDTATYHLWCVHTPQCGFFSPEKSANRNSAFLLYSNIRHNSSFKQKIKLSFFNSPGCSFYLPHAKDPRRAADLGTSYHFILSWDLLMLFKESLSHTKICCLVHNQMKQKTVEKNYKDLCWCAGQGCLCACQSFWVPPSTFHPSVWRAAEGALQTGNKQDTEISETLHCLFPSSPQSLAV